MAHYPDPCYCSQASEYEELLERCSAVLSRYGARMGPDAGALLQDITDSLRSYQDAQREYVEDDS